MRSSRFSLYGCVDCNAVGETLFLRVLLRLIAAAPVAAVGCGFSFELRRERRDSRASDADVDGAGTHKARSAGVMSVFRQNRQAPRRGRTRSCNVIAC